MKRYSHLFFAVFLVTSSIPMYPGNSNSSWWTFEGISNGIMSCLDGCRSMVSSACSSFSTEAKVALGGLATFIGAYVGYKVWGRSRVPSKGSTVSKRQNPSLASSALACGTEDLKNYFMSSRKDEGRLEAEEEHRAAVELAIHERRAIELRFYKALREKRKKAEMARIVQEKAERERLAAEHRAEEIRRAQEESKRKIAEDDLWLLSDDEIVTNNTVGIPEDDQKEQQGALDDDLVNLEAQEKGSGSQSKERKILQEVHCRRELVPFGYQFSNALEEEDFFEMPIMEACARGDLDRLKTLLFGNRIWNNIGFCADRDLASARDKNGNTPIMIASKYGQKAVVQVFKEAFILSDFRCLLYEKNKDGNTPLIIAVKKGFEKLVAFYLDLEAGTIKEVNKRGESALMVAAQEGNFNMVKLLLKKVSESHVPSLITNFQGNNPLTWVIKQGHINVVRFILKKGSGWRPKYLKELENMVCEMALSDNSNMDLNVLRRELGDKMESDFTKLDDVRIATFLKVLGLRTKETNMRKVKKRYRALSHQYHPDKQRGKSKEEQDACQSRMREINHAYGELEKLYRSVYSIA